MGVKRTSGGNVTKLKITNGKLKFTIGLKPKTQQDVHFARDAKLQKQTIWRSITPN